MSLNPVAQPRWDFSANFGVADERGVYSGERSLSLLLRRTLNKSDASPTASDIYSASIAAAAYPDRRSGVSVPRDTPVPTYCVGPLEGIKAGPGVHLIDLCGLTDRFIAESTFRPEKPYLWRMGHFNRPLPEGYWEAVSTGDPRMVKDPVERQRLVELWSQIR